MRSFGKYVVLLLGVSLGASATKLYRDSREARRPRGAPMNGDSSLTDRIQVLDREVLRERTVAIFPGAYTTLLSIVQGLALALLVSRFAEVVTSTNDTRLAWVQLAMSATLIVLIYYMYTWFVLVVRWPPTVWDTVIPLALGGLEAGLILGLGSTSHWLLASALMLIGGAAAFFHSILRLRPEMFAESRVHDLLRRVLMQLMFASVGGALVSSLSWLWTRGGHEWSITLGTTAAITSLGIVMIWVSEIAVSKVFRMNGLRWIRRLDGERPE